MPPQSPSTPRPLPIEGHELELIEQLLRRAMTRLNQAIKDEVDDVGLEDRVLRLLELREKFKARARREENPPKSGSPSWVG